LALVVTHPTTADKLLRGQLAYLRKEGFDILLISSPGPGLERAGAREGVQTLGLAMEREINPLKDLLSLFRLIQALAKWRPDIVNVGTPKAGLLGGLAAWICRVPRRFYTLRGLRLETTTGFKRRLLATTERIASACAHRVVCVSPSLRQRYAALRLSRPEKLMVLGGGGSHGIDMERFRIRAKDPEAMASLGRDLGIPPGAPVIGFVGRWTQDKGLAELLGAFRTIEKAIPNVYLLALGDFESGDPVDPETARGWREHQRILRPGQVPETSPYYPLMQVLAFPSFREGMPNVPLEAAAAGLPIVGFRVTGTIDAVQDGHTGALVPSGDSAALADALLAYLQNPALARLHGTAGRERVEALFSNETVWRQWRDAYRAPYRVMAQQPKPRDEPKASS
jgi:glycosyltransferase involved in cell wall biosynthesis